MADSFLGSGVLYASRLTEAGVMTGIERFGNVTKCELQANAEFKEQTSTGRDDYGHVIASVTLQKPGNIKLAVNQLNQDSQELAFLAESEAVAITGDTVADENIVAISGKFVKLENQNVTITSVTRDNGSGAAAWAATTEYATGVFKKPTAGGATRFYEATTGGTTGGTEPTWPTNGGTVVDGTVTWTDRGLIVASSATDYEVNTRLGIIRCLSTGMIEDGEALSVAYTYASKTGYKIKGMTAPAIRVYLELDGKNLTNGKDCVVRVFDARIKPSSAVDYLAPDFTAIELEGTMMTPEDQTHPFEITYFD